jgi:hypothetical protein
MSRPSPRLRLATTADLPAITALVLTSFRSFPLFDYLYHPLDVCEDYAHDTVFLWRMRVHLALCDPAAMVVVAEVPAAEVSDPSSLGLDQTEAITDATRMWQWTVNKAGLSQYSTDGKAVVVGFAIWLWKHVVPLPSMSLSNRALSQYCNASYSRPLVMGFPGCAMYRAAVVSLFMPSRTIFHHRMTTLFSRLVHY